jgi:hypothetical protein
MSTLATQQPTPQLFFQTINSYQRTEALKAAIELFDIPDLRAFQDCLNSGNGANWRTTIS